MGSFDSIVIGAGHNGLVCANYLARRGRRVLVVESSDNCGGLASTYEFHPGYRSSLAGHVSHLPRRIVDDLKLQEFGFTPLRTPPDVVGLATDGEHVRLSAGHIHGVSSAEQDAYHEYSRLIGRFAKLLTPFWQKTVPPIGNNSLPEMMAFAELGLKIRLLGREDMQEFFRVVTLPMQDLMDEFFQNPLLQSTLSWDGLIGCRQAPRSPNNSVLQLLYRLAEESVATCDVTSLVEAMVQSAEAKGVEIRTGTGVEKILLDAYETGLTASGIRLSSGEEIAADSVISSADPKTTFLTLLGAENLEIEFTNRVQRIRDRGLVSNLHLALKELPSFRGLDNPDGRLLIAPDLEMIEWAYDDAKYGDVPKEPVIEISIPSLHNNQLAPDGHHVLSANIMYTPYEQKNDWDENSRSELLQRAYKQLEEYAPGICDSIVACELLTPTDLEDRFNVSGGHWHHGDIAFDQYLMMRPTYEAAQYKTPIDGLYLCGAGTHPGGDVTGTAGFNAAREVLS